MIERCYKCNVAMRFVGFLYSDGQNHGTQKLRCPQCGKEITKKYMMQNDKRRREDKIPRKTESGRKKDIRVGQNTQQKLQPRQNQMAGKGEHRAIKR